MDCRLDHLVVAARCLDEGEAWLSHRLGVALAAGGRHTAMATHNRLLGLGPDAYLELIAIDPQAVAPGRPRWFDLDSPALAGRLARGPALVGWVARCRDIAASSGRPAVALGRVLELARGDLVWRITVPDDGSRIEGGIVPYLIQWVAGAHPAARLPERGCRLAGLTAGHPRPEHPRRILATLGLAASLAAVEPSAQPWLRARLQSPLGEVILE